MQEVLIAQTSRQKRCGQGRATLQCGKAIYDINLKGSMPQVQGKAATAAPGLCIPLAA